MIEQLALLDTGRAPRCAVCWAALEIVQLTYTTQTIMEDCIRAACIRTRREALQSRRDVVPKKRCWESVGLALQVVEVQRPTRATPRTDTLSLFAGLGKE